MTEADRDDRDPGADTASEKSVTMSDQARIETFATYTYLLAYTIPLAVTSLLALSRGDFALAAALGLFAVVALLIMVHVYRFGLGRRIRVLLVAAAAVLFIYLLMSGGYAGTSLFWCFAVFVAIYHFSTAWLGLAINLALLAVSTVLLLAPLFEPLRPDYGAATISRFLICGSITCVLIFFYAMRQQVLMASLQATQEQLLHTSLTDELTGLSNRRSMKATLAQENRRHPGPRLLAIAIADLDHFKRINDTLGHDAGDHALRHVAGVMRDSLRESDRVARWGGEEFLILLDVLSPEEADEVIERVRAAIEGTAISYGDQSIPLTASFGLKVVATRGAPLHEAIAAADNNLLQAKELGRNRVVAS